MLPITTRATCEPIILNVCKTCIGLHVKRVFCEQVGDRMSNHPRPHHAYLANRKRQTHASLMLGHRRRRWANVKPVVGK